MHILHYFLSKTIFLYFFLCQKFYQRYIHLDHKTHSVLEVSIYENVSNTGKITPFKSLLANLLGELVLAPL